MLSHSSPQRRTRIVLAQPLCWLNPELRSKVSSSYTALSYLDPCEFRNCRLTSEGVLDLSVWPSTNSDEDSPDNATSTSSSQQGASGTASGSPAQPRRHPAAEALLRGGHPALGFGFSAGGLLFPYYIGVMYGLHDLAVITCECWTPL